MKIDPIPPGYKRLKAGTEGEIYRLSSGALLVFDELEYVINDPRYNEISDGRAQLIGLDGSPEAVAKWNERCHQLDEWELEQCRRKLAHYRLTDAQREELVQEERELRHRLGAD